MVQTEFCARRAKALLDKGLAAVSQGNVEEALLDFKASSYVSPSAESYTYWGWMEGRLGNFAKAIEYCERAIEIDPEFGNPYNDIGTYLVSLGREDEAISWFDKAKNAKRYEPRQYPHINLGRIYLSKKLYKNALDEFQDARRFAPNNQEINWAIDFIQKLIN